MLANLVVDIWASKPKLSPVFWLATALSYIVGILAVASIFHADLNFLQATGTVGERAAFHLSVVRVVFIGIILLVFPVLLFTSLRRLFYFMVGITAWVAIIYVDDLLVLYTIMHYPQSAAMNFVIAVRPLVLIGLLWMCFELNMRLEDGP
jgi:hypothetical protein